MAESAERFGLDLQRLGDEDFATRVVPLEPRAAMVEIALLHEADLGRAEAVNVGLGDDVEIDDPRTVQDGTGVFHCGASRRSREQKAEDQAFHRFTLS